MLVYEPGLVELLAIATRVHDTKKAVNTASPQKLAFTELPIIIIGLRFTLNCPPALRSMADHVRSCRGVAPLYSLLFIGYRSEKNLFRIC